MPYIHSVLFGDIFYFGMHNIKFTIYFTLIVCLYSIQQLYSIHYHLLCLLLLFYLPLTIFRLLSRFHFYVYFCLAPHSLVKSIYSNQSNIIEGVLHFCVNLDI